MGGDGKLSVAIAPLTKAISGLAEPSIPPSDSDVDPDRRIPSHGSAQTISIAESSQLSRGKLSVANAQMLQYFYLRPTTQALLRMAQTR